MDQNWKKKAKKIKTSRQAKDPKVVWLELMKDFEKRDKQQGKELLKAGWPDLFMQHNSKETVMTTLRQFRSVFEKWGITQEINETYRKHFGK